VIYYILISFKNVGVNLLEEVVNDTEICRTNMRLYFCVKCAFVYVIDERCTCWCLL